MYITGKPSVQFCTFPHTVYKGTKTTDFFVTVVSQCNQYMIELHSEVTTKQARRLGDGGGTTKTQQVLILLVTSLNTRVSKQV